MSSSNFFPFDLKPPRCLKKQDIRKTKKVDSDLKFWTSGPWVPHHMGGKILKIPLMSCARSSGRDCGRGLKAIS